MADQARFLTDLELVRTPDDRRTYRLGDVGTLSFTGFWGRSAVATAGDRTWQLSRTSLWQASSVATDAAGVEVGRFGPRALKRGGTLAFGGRSYLLRPASAWRERYALVGDDDAELALFDGKGWGRRPVAVTLLPGRALEPGLLLYAAYVVRGLAEDASGAAGGSVAVVASTGC